MSRTCTVLFTFLFFAATVCAEEKKPHEHEVAIKIKIHCPMSEELIKLVQSLPYPEDRSVDFEDWKTSFVHSMSELIHLVESGKISSSSWAAKTDDPLWQRIKQPNK